LAFISDAVFVFQMVGYVFFDMFGTQKALDIRKYIIDGFGQTRFIVAACNWKEDVGSPKT
jgi:pyruvate dehydrogenase complex dehydrogenase (E1) component